MRRQRGHYMPPAFKFIGGVGKYNPITEGFYFFY